MRGGLSVIIGFGVTPIRRRLFSVTTPSGHPPRRHHSMELTATTGTLIEHCNEHPGLESSLLDGALRNAA